MMIKIEKFYFEKKLKLSTGTGKMRLINRMPKARIIQNNIRIFVG